MKVAPTNQKPTSPGTFIRQNWKWLLALSIGISTPYSIYINRCISIVENYDPNNDPNDYLTKNHAGNDRTFQPDEIKDLEKKLTVAGTFEGWSLTEEQYGKNLRDLNEALRQIKFENQAKNILK